MRFFFLRSSGLAPLAAWAGPVGDLQIETSKSSRLDISSLRNRLILGISKRSTQLSGGATLIRASVDEIERF